MKTFQTIAASILIVALIVTMFIPSIAYFTCIYTLSYFTIPFIISVVTNGKSIFNQGVK